MLYNIAVQNDITVDYYCLKHQPCFSVQDNNFHCYIAIDYKRIKSDKDEKEKLAHEIGHCMTGTFYNRSSPLQNKEQMEWRATLWAIKKLIPKDELQKAVKNGIIELWELAERFEVSEDIMQKAVEYYKNN